jgi:predicted ATPase/DNA-binding SARP family transcriptional activator
MEVGILGPLMVADGGRLVEIGGARLRALLIRLAANAGGWVSVGELVEDLWEGDPPGDEVNALQSLVSRLRRALPAAELIESGPAGYRLAVDPDAVDGIRFERLAVQGRRRLRDGDPELAFTLLTEALALWRGPALIEVAAAAYAVIWAQRLEKLRLAAAENRGAAGLQLGRHPELVAELEEVAEQNPLRERTHELLIRALAGSGRQAEALAVYERLSRRLAGELGLDPPVHLQRLQTAVLRSDADELVAADRVVPRSILAPPPPPRPRPTNLRSPLTSFVGRESEIAQLYSLIQLRSRLITLVGTGGAGKTRLASEAMAKMHGLGPDGVWMVQLAPVTDPEDVASSVLGSIGPLDLQILERPIASHRDALSRLVETLADHDVVLVLDNCEHVLDAAAKLAEFLLGQCPRLRILATSREPLGIVGESLCQVQPLSVPEPDTTTAAALDTPAVKLFIDRASLVRPGFSLTAENAGPVVEICRRLDGLPLAIELAAARLRSLPVEAISVRLSNRFRLLTGGNRTAMPRHQTLRAVVAWSWELLTPSERILAARLSVFPGGATAEAAEVVCVLNCPEAEDAVSQDTVADLMISLADKSLLVVVEPTAGGGEQPRYRMLETIREFAGEQLGERGESTTVRAAHARFFLALAEAAEPKLRGADQLIWLDRLTTERDNLLAALRFAAETDDSDTAIRLGAALAWYWTLLGRHDEAANWIDQALKVPGERPVEPYTIAYVVHAISAAASGQGLPTQEQIDELLGLVNELDLAQAHPILALVEPGFAMITDDRDRALHALERNLNHADPWARAMLHLMSAVQAENDGDIETLEQRLPLALAEFREIGDRWGIGTATATLGNLYSAQGKIEEAISALQEARQLMTQLHAADDEAYTLIRIGMLRLRLGDREGASRDVEAALETAQRTGSTMSSSFASFGLAMLAHDRGRTDEARRLAFTALDMIERAPFAPPQVNANIYCGLAIFDIATGYLDDAAAWLHKSYEAVMASRDMPVAGNLATVVADLARARGDFATAAELLGIGVRLRGMPDLGDPQGQRVAEAVQAALPPEDFGRHHDAGQKLTRDEALARLKAAI